jgi:hypothetical protein
MSQFSDEQLKKMKDLTSEQTIGAGVMKALFGNATYNKVLCNDGSIQTQANYPNARVMDACAKNGGRSANQPIDFTKYEQVKAESFNEGGMYVPTKGKEDITKKILGAYNQNLIIALVLVAGYFAYKKFKK